MNKQEIIDKHRKYLFSCVATYYDEPLVVDHAKDNYVYDIDGKEYLDFFGGILTVSVGHCNEKVTKAIDEQTHKLQHASTLYPNEPHVRLAENWRRSHRDGCKNLSSRIAAPRRMRPRS